MSILLDATLALRESLEAELPAIVALVNAEYADKVDATIEAPKGYLLGIRSDLLDKLPAALPLLCCGIYGQDIEWEGEQQFSRKKYAFMVQVWLAGTDEGTLFTQQGMWEDCLDYFIQEHGSKLLKGLRAPEAPDTALSNTIPDGNGYYRGVVQAAGSFEITK